MADYTSKTLIVISGGIEAVEGIREAKELGLRVIVADGDEQCPGKELADFFFHISTYDAMSLLNRSLDFQLDEGRIHGVISIASDVPVSVATLNTGLDLPGISLKAAALASDKYLMKRYLSRAGIPIPDFLKVSKLETLQEARERLGTPFILKPVDSRGARGVLRITDHMDMEWAYNYALSFSPSQTLIAEEFLQGPQVSTESIVMDGRFHHLGFSDRNYELLEEYAPFMIENGGELPSVLPTEDQQSIIELVEQAAMALGFDHGTVKGDMVLTRSGPKVIELAPRLSGGYFATHEIPLNTGVNFVRAAIRLALGEKVPVSELRPRKNTHIVQRYFFPPAGKLVSIKNIHEAANMEWVKLFKIYYSIGATIAPVTSHVKRGGVFMVEGSTREQALERAQAIYDLVQWEVEEPADSIKAKPR